MDNIVIFEREQLLDLIDELKNVVEQAKDMNVYRVRACVDGGLKLKVNEGTWSRPLGKMQP